MHRPDPGAFPAWPIDLSADFLADLGGVPTARAADGPAPVVLTHDLDSAEGLRNAVELFLPLEEEAGATSVSYIVPCAWPVDRALTDAIVRRGHELGVHGYDHGNRTAFLDAARRRARLEEGRRRLEGYDVRGYRAPSLLRTRPLFGDLASLYAYDSSIPTSGGPLPVPGTGCATARPFEIDGIAELPLSLPRDGSLRFLGTDPRGILALWKECTLRIAASGGVTVLLTHCEARFSGNPDMLAVYREFLAFVRQDARLCWRRPRQVLERLDRAP
jgi:peptidoglycan/xylan/chitin deacetylase (PgdA/CDA1 family)